MIDWVEYAIARHAAQLHNAAAERPLTETEQSTFSVCHSVIVALEARDALPPHEAAASRMVRRRRASRWGQRKAS